jgi:hypothetical protein
MGIDRHQVKSIHETGTDPVTGEKSTQNRSYGPDGRLRTADTTFVHDGKTTTSNTTLDENSGKYNTSTKIMENGKVIGEGTRTDNPDGTFESTLRSRDLDVHEVKRADGTYVKDEYKKKMGRISESIHTVDNPETGRTQTVENDDERMTTNWDKDGHPTSRSVRDKKTNQFQKYVPGNGGWVPAGASSQEV